jgi:hypothetical protein
MVVISAALDAERHPEAIDQGRALLPQRERAILGR